MSGLSRRVCTHAITVMALSLSAGVVEAQSDADLKAVSATTLTMPKYKQYLDASVNLANVAAKDPEIAEGLKDSDQDKSIAETVKMLESNSQVRGAITSTGLTTRDYVLTQWALIQTGMAYAMTKGSGAQDEVINKAGVSKANLDFYAKNEAEINRLAKEAEARAPKSPENSGSDSD